MVAGSWLSSLVLQMIYKQNVCWEVKTIKINVSSLPQSLVSSDRSFWLQLFCTSECSWRSLYSTADNIRFRCWREKNCIRADGSHCKASDSFRDPESSITKFDLDCIQKLDRSISVKLCSSVTKQSNFCHLVLLRFQDAATVTICHRKSLTFEQVFVDCSWT